MALIESLIDKVEDPKLKARLLAEVKALKERKDFGLVFERHLPESVLLPHTVGVEVGTEVRLRKEWNKPDNFIVTSAKGNSLTLESIDEDDKGKKEELEVRKEDVMVVRRFNQPIYPYLKDIGSVKNGGDKDPHLVIRSENYHALKLLEHTHAGKLDVIYIDPPYNTGDRNWQYNNNYIDGNDAYRHSRWLSFMERRLLISKKLLKKDGVLIVTIDEHEVNNLGVLLEQLFPEAVVQMVTMVINAKGVASDYVPRVEEHAFFCFFGDAKANRIGDDLLTPINSETDQLEAGGAPIWPSLLRTGTGATRVDRKGQFYPILIDPDKGKIMGVGEPLLPKKDKDGKYPPPEEWPSPNLDEKIDGYTAIWPIRSGKNGKDAEGRWMVQPSTLRELIKQGYVKIGKYNKDKKTCKVSYLSRILREQMEAGLLKEIGKDKVTGAVEIVYAGDPERMIKRVWHRARHSSGPHGTGILTTFLGGKRAFSYPKSLYLVYDCLSAVLRDKPNAQILDFFAGSGTTLQATCLLNSFDNGNRRCILVTNNELEGKESDALMKKGLYPGDSDYEANGVFESATKPRAIASITGRLPDGSIIEGQYSWPKERLYSEGFNENCQFLQLDYLDSEKIELGSADAELFSIEWMLAGAHGMLPSKAPANKKGFVVFEKHGFAVLNEPSALKDCIQYFDQSSNITHLFIATEYTDTFVSLSEALPRKVSVYQMPKDYLKFFTKRETS